ncbi:MAG: hypothetical protein ACRED3_16210, partial [Bradyrhizobium sp.]
MGSSDLRPQSGDSTPHRELLRGIGQIGAPPIFSVTPKTRSSRMHIQLMQTYSLCLCASTATVRHQPGLCSRELASQSREDRAACLRQRRSVVGHRRAGPGRITIQDLPGSGDKGSAADTSAPPHWLGFLLRRTGTADDVPAP